MKCGRLISDKQAISTRYLAKIWKWSLGLQHMRSTLIAGKHLVKRTESYFPCGIVLCPDCTLIACNRAGILFIEGEGRRLRFKMILLTLLPESHLGIELQVGFSNILYYINKVLLFPLLWMVCIIPKKPGRLKDFLVLS